MPRGRRIAWASFWLGTALWALLLASRALYYSVTSLPWPVEGMVELLMRSRVAFFTTAIGLPLVVLEIPMLLVLVVLFAWRRRWFLEPARAGGLGFRPWVMGFAGPLFALNDVFFDADPYMAKLCAVSVPLLALGLTARDVAATRTRRVVALAAIAVLLVLGWWWAPSPACAWAVAVWGLCLALVAALGRGTLRPAHAVWLAVLLVPLATFGIPIVLAGAIRDPLWAKARLLESEGYAYGFCEFPEHHQFFLTVPVCQTGQIGQCMAGYVAEYDSRDFSHRRVHRFFDAGFRGALRNLVCVDDVVQVAMSRTQLGDKVPLTNVMEFRRDDPRQFRRTIFPEEVLRGDGSFPGHQFAYDPKRDAVIYVSEWTNRIFRLDRRTGVLDLHAGDHLPSKPFAPLRNYGLTTGPEAVDRGRDSMFAAQWVDGSEVWELGLSDLRIRSRYSTHDTGSFGVAVDEEYGRLILSGLWGVNVLDLQTGQVLARKRLGPGVRIAQIDSHHGLIYLGTTFGSHIWVLDRASLETLGRITTGLGARIPHVSADGSFLLTSNQHSTYLHESEEVLRHLRLAPNIGSR
jgi:hypothetical protein